MTKNHYVGSSTKTQLFVGRLFVEDSHEESIFFVGYHSSWASYSGPVPFFVVPGSGLSIKATCCKQIR
ncbi:hypothetical protein HanRHA438_Chr09g0393211 [Helianthus annuus]|nr:hypothetical protein HanRHA438_Chr09g0393211 [Helianthus annuus]